MSQLIHRLICKPLTTPTAAVTQSRVIEISAASLAEENRRKKNKRRTRLRAAQVHLPLPMTATEWRECRKSFKCAGKSRGVGGEIYDGEPPPPSVWASSKPRKLVNVELELAGKQCRPMNSCALVEPVWIVGYVLSTGVEYGQGCQIDLMRFWDEFSLIS